MLDCDLARQFGGNYAPTTNRSKTKRAMPGLQPRFPVGNRQTVGTPLELSFALV
jgi:hypothetical protein